jgi:hypothetical protein
MRLLVVDFDSFFPFIDPPDDGWEFYDWGHSEGWSPSLLQTLWVSRATMFVQNNMPLPCTSGLERSFWHRFQIHPRASYYVSDSNVWSICPKVRQRVSEVMLFDAHHDCGYRKELVSRYSCEDWALWYLARHIPLTVNYPHWRQHVFAMEDFCYGEQGAFPLTRRFDDNASQIPVGRIHVCRSSAWVPPWCEKAFWRFVHACPAKKKPQYLGGISKRLWSEKWVQDDVKQWEKVNEFYDK